MTGIIINLVILAVIAGAIAYGVTTLIDHEKEKAGKLKQIAKELEKINKKHPRVIGGFSLSKFCWICYNIRVKNPLDRGGFSL